MQEKVPTNGAAAFDWVGTRPVRPDGVDKVTGRARFGADLAMQGQLVGRVLRSPHPHARIRSIDTSAAAAPLVGTFSCMRQAPRISAAASSTARTILS